MTTTDLEELMGDVLDSAFQPALLLRSCRVLFALETSTWNRSDKSNLYQNKFHTKKVKHKATHYDSVWGGTVI